MSAASSVLEISTCPHCGGSLSASSRRDDSAGGELSSVPMPAALVPLGDDVAPQLLRVAQAAVDRLEVAAALETWGLSNSLVSERLGQRDVFSLADQVYDQMDHRAAPLTDTRLKRGGKPLDLARGLVFAVPTLMFAGAVVDLRNRLSWWSMPLALLCGWTVGQFVSFAGFSQRARGKTAATAVAWSLIAAAVLSGALGFGCQALLGGNSDAVVLAVIACTFMTASAVLVAFEEVHLIALMLVPGALGAIVFITRQPFVLSPDVATYLAGVSVVATLVAALRHTPRHWWRAAAIPRSDAAPAARYVFHGLCCGVLVALFVGLDPARHGSRSWPAVAAYPMILSLGMMEWQLRSLRRAARKASLGSGSLRQFVRRSRFALVRSVAFYLVALAVLTAGVQALASALTTPTPETLVIAGSLLAAAFFIALVVAACDRMDLVLRCWTAGLAVYGGWLAVAWISGNSASTSTQRVAFCSALAVAVVGLFVSALLAIARPSSHA